MQKRILGGAFMTLAGMLLAIVLTTSAAAAPVGAATNLSVGTQICHANGTVSAILSWSPSGLGSQSVQIATDVNFNNRSTGGPYASAAGSVNMTQLKPGATYYARVLTASSVGTLVSDIIVVAVRNCLPGADITEPTDLEALAVSESAAQLDWRAGENNIWYCVDIARSLPDLLNTRNSWRNFGCWTTNTNLTVTGLACDTVYYWLVYAWNTTSNVKSDPEVFETDSCASTISPPTNLDADLIDGSVLFDWSPGMGNIWYCVDTAPTQSALLNLGTGWRNHGCWNTSSQLLVTGLDCGKTYYWLVYAWNHIANTKSAVATVETPPCGAHLELAPIEDVDVVKVGDSYRAEIRAALPNGCHSPDSHLVHRSGNTIEITVWNSVVPGPCTFIYSEYDLSINLGDDFDSGETYEVVVNDDESVTFVAD